MRVAILAPVGRPTPPGERGGRRDTISLLAEELMACGVEVSLFPARGFPAGHDSNGDGLYPGVLEWLRLGEFLEGAHAFDLIHNWAGVPPFGYAAFVKRPIVTTIQEPCSETDLAVYRRYAKKTFYVSGSYTERSSDLQYKATVYPGIEVKSVTLGGNPGDFLFVLGTASKGRGVREAVDLALKTDKKLVIGGPIEDPNFLEADTRHLLEKGRIEYVEDLAPDRRDELLAGAAALIYTGAYPEVFPLVALEANALGTPVIAPDRGIIAEIVVDGVNGFLVSDIANADEAVKSLGTLSRADCRKVVEERFSAHRMAQEYIKVYRGILQTCQAEECRPWGYYEILSDHPDHKVKRIVVYPGKRLSLQRHSRRFEHWTVITGSPVVTLDDDDVTLGPGESIAIPQGARHRIYNPGDELVVFVEVQTGDYFGEDDIERFEDDFGRA